MKNSTVGTLSIHIVSLSIFGISLILIRLLHFLMITGPYALCILTNWVLYYGLYRGIKYFYAMSKE